MFALTVKQAAFISPDLLRHSTVFWLDKTPITRWSFKLLEYPLMFSHRKASKS